AARAVKVLAKPSLQRAELALRNLRGNFRMRAQRCRVELRAQHVADRVAMESAADAAAVPMNILQATVTIVRRAHAKVGAIARLPRLRQIFDGEAPLEQLDLEIEPQHDVQIVSQLVGIGSYQRARNLVDGAMEGFDRHVRERGREGFAERRIEVPPQAEAAPDDIFPEPRLALMNAHRRPPPERRAAKRGRDSLFVEGMPSFMQGREQRLAQIVRLD